MVTWEPYPVVMDDLDIFLSTKVLNDGLMGGGVRHA